MSETVRKAELEDQLYGCVIFDDPQMHAAGWACISGEEPSRIEGTYALRSDVVWVTNLGYEIARSGGLNGHARFRRADYLKSSGFEKILAEIGVASASDMARAGAILVERVMRLTRKHLNIQETPMESLRKGVMKHLNLSAPQMPESIRAAIAESTSAYTTCERPSWDDGMVMRKFLPPRIRHGREILSIPYPSGRWHALVRRQLPRGRQAVGDGLAEWLLGLPGPALAKITMERCDPDMNGLLNFGSGLNSDNTRRGWVSTPELFFLLRFADIRINAVYLCDDISLHPLSGLAELAFADDLNQVSLSAGVFMENLWQGLASPLVSRMPNPLAPFIRAQDRMACLRYAHRLKLAGFTVTGYGAGMVVVQVPECGAEQMLLEAAREFELMPPACGLSAEKDNIKSSGSGPLQIMQSLYARGSFDNILAMDQFVLDKLH